MDKAIVFGAGLSGLGAKELLEKKGYFVYLVDDKIGMSSTEALEIMQNESIEMIIKSPGIYWNVPLLEEAKKRNIKVMSEIDLAYQYMNKEIKIIGITGTNGKTTTATKIYELLKKAGNKVALAGNAGYSFAKLVADEIVLEYVVLELSSYQLENNPIVHVNIAGNINLTPDHLTRYESLDDYYVTKFNIFKNQNESDYSLINADDEEFKSIAKREKVKKFMNGKKVILSKETLGNIFVYNEKIYMTKDLNTQIQNVENYLLNIDNIATYIIDVDDLSLKGKHNLENVLFMIGVAKILNIDVEVLRDFLKTTKALEHRLENFFKLKNTLFINDSKGTNVESTIKAIESFKNDILLICGGEDKKISNTELIKKINEKVIRVYLIGETAKILAKELDNIGYSNYEDLHTLENVLYKIKETIDFNKNQTILFSPATASFDQFKNFEERGRIFKELTNRILGEI